ncbi:MAG: sigma-54-dependent Fis family transcriptional regulator, partial [Desulfovibrio fairfieldensis]|nr:sigma-54-dependent Fis family transcriptional regulator [Desulfovibrio fairfieldensis]
MLSPDQAAHVLALHLAPRPLSADELRWLTGEAARPDDAARKQGLAALERLRMAERVPGGTPRWRAGPAAGAFVRARLFAGLWPPEHRAGALLSLLDEGAGPRRCTDILRGAWAGGRADVELVPLLEVLVAFLMRWCARRAADPAALDGGFLNLLFALQGFPLSSLSLLRKILRLTARAYRMARNSGNERFMAMLLLSRLYLHVFVGNNSSRLADRLEAALNTVKALLGPEDDNLLPLFEGQLAYMRGDLKKIIACFNRCSEDMAWCHRRFYDTLGVCALFSAGYLHQFHFALGSVEHFQRKAMLAGDELTAAMFRSNSCFLLLRKGDRQRMRAVLRALEASPLYAEHSIVHSHVTRAHALLLFMEGDARGAHTLLDVRTRRLLARGDKPVTFKDPLVLDMLYVFSRNGWPAIPGYEADALLRSLLQGANRHLKGTAMRIRALQLLDAAATPCDAVALLRQSLDIFRTLGDPHSLTLTVHALARAQERDGDAGEARLLHDMVREATGRDLRGVEYHEACRACLEVCPAAFELFGAAFSEAGLVGKSVSERCHAIFSALDLPDSCEEALQHFVRAAMDAFRQERGGLFRPGEGEEPRFAHIANVSALELRSPAMRPCLDWLAEAARRSRR